MLVLPSLNSLINEQTRINEYLWCENFFIYYMKIESMVENYLIYCIQILKMDFTLRLFFQYSHELAQEVPEVLLPFIWTSWIFRASSIECFRSRFNRVPDLTWSPFSKAGLFFGFNQIIKGFNYLILYSKTRLLICKIRIYK